MPQMFQMRHVGTKEISISTVMNSGKAIELMSENQRVFVLAGLNIGPIDEDGNREVMIRLVPGNGMALIEESGEKPVWKRI